MVCSISVYHRHVIVYNLDIRIDSIVESTWPAVALSSSVGQRPNLGLVTGGHLLPALQFP